jgi:hypothetical protein
MDNQQQENETQARLVEALDRFHQGRETEDDLSVIQYFTGLTNYRPQREVKHESQ